MGTDNLTATLRASGQRGDATTIQITKDEFIDMLQMPGVTLVLDNIGVDVVGVLDVLDILFVHEIISLADLIEGILQLRSCNTATVKDLMAMRKFLSHAIEDLSFAVKRCSGGSASTKGVHNS